MKLTAKDVKQIRQMVLDCVPQIKIAAHFGIHQSMVSKIKNNKYWCDVGGPDASAAIHCRSMRDTLTVDTIFALLDLGFNQYDLARLYNIEQGQISSFLAKEGITCRSYISDELIYEMKRLYCESWSIRDIAYDLEVSEPTVSRYVRAQGTNAK